jgi:two-component system sensor histidine kinase KdpD
MAVKLAGSAAAVAAATLVVWALEPIAPTLSLGVLYTLPVLAVSVLWGIGFALATALASMLAFNCLFLPPVHTLTLADGRNWAALAVYLATAVVASELAARARRRAREAEQREQEAALLADAAAALLRDAPLDDLDPRLARVRTDASAGERLDAAMASLRALAGERATAQRIRHSDELKTLILHTVSHDFRTPLATIRAAADGLELPLDDADRAALIETIQIETERLGRLVENVLDVSRLQAGAAVSRPELWAPRDLLEDAAREASDPARVSVHVAEQLPAARVDAAQIQRVLVNLVENALRYSTGGVELRATAREGRVVLDVLDRGPGLEAPARGGLGLGLEIARGFAAANGGTLVLGARLGGGTRARVTLPAEPIPSGVAS